jgi:FAD/FMN-containing dehydrogenase
MTRSSIKDLSPLKEFLSSNPHIHHATRSSPDYSTLRSTYIINDNLHPSMIVRPQSADDVAGLIRVLTSHSIPFTVRTGGHDLFGRSVAHDAVTIDMRDIAHVKIDKASLSARIGGGIIVMDLLTQLGKENLVTAAGTIPSVGYVGWATHGGYGVLSQNYGLGADQILGAKVVNGKGKIVDADEKLLKGIRGGGGAFGVIVELTIKVYELDSVSTCSTQDYFNGNSFLCILGLITSKNPKAYLTSSLPDSRGFD